MITAVSLGARLFGTLAIGGMLVGAYWFVKNYAAEHEERLVRISQLELQLKQQKQVQQAAETETRLANQTIAQLEQRQLVLGADLDTTCKLYRDLKSSPKPETKAALAEDPLGTVLDHIFARDAAREAAKKAAKK